MEVRRDAVPGRWPGVAGGRELAPQTSGPFLPPRGVMAKYVRIANGDVAVAQRVEKKDPRKALELYTRAIETLLTGVKGDTSASRVSVVREQVALHLEHAEALKADLEASLPASKEPDVAGSGPAPPAEGENDLVDTEKPLDKTPETNAGATPKGQVSSRHRSGRPVFTRISGVSLAADDVASAVKEAIRDVTVGRLRAKVEAADKVDSGHCYYLRSAARKCHVDHTFECQLMGHAVVQTAAWHKLLAADSFLDGKIGSTGKDQAVVLLAFLGRCYLPSDFGSFSIQGPSARGSPMSGLCIIASSICTCLTLASTSPRDPYSRRLCSKCPAGGTCARPPRGPPRCMPRLSALPSFWR